MSRYKTILNESVGDYGELASADKKTKPYYISYCTTDECCYTWSYKRYFLKKDKTDGPAGSWQTVRVRSQHRVNRRTKQETYVKSEVWKKCPDCNSDLIHTMTFD